MPRIGSEESYTHVMSRDKDGKPKEWVRGCYPNGKATVSIERRCTTRHGRTSRVDEAEASNLIFIESVHDWGGFMDEDGKELECNETNRRLIVENHSDLANQILDGFKEARELVREGEIDAQGNSLGTPKQSSDSTES